MNIPECANQKQKARIAALGVDENEIRNLLKEERGRNAAAGHRHDYSSNIHAERRQQARANLARIVETAVARINVDLEERLVRVRALAAARRRREMIAVAGAKHSAAIDKMCVAALAEEYERAEAFQNEAAAEDKVRKELERKRDADAEAAAATPRRRRTTSRRRTPRRRRPRPAAAAAAAAATAAPSAAASPDTDAALELEWQRNIFAGFPGLRDDEPAFASGVDARPDPPKVLVDMQALVDASTEGGGRKSRKRKKRSRRKRKRRRSRKRKRTKRRRSRKRKRTKRRR